MGRFNESSVLSSRSIDRARDIQIELQVTIYEERNRSGYERSPASAKL